MATERKRSASRQNALKSTGPRSREGKQKSSQNALRHGLSTPSSQRALKESAGALSMMIAAEFGLDPQQAFDLAEAIYRVDCINQAQQALIEQERLKLPTDTPFELGVDLARLATLSRVGPLAELEHRASTKLRKQLKLLGG